MKKEKELVAFGNYLLSEGRRESYKANPMFGEETLNERLSQVSDADIQNFKFKKQ